MIGAITMPIFEYECKECIYRFEKLVRGQEKICCPQCNSYNLKKLISTCGRISDDTKYEWGNPSLPNKQEFERKKYEP